MFAAYLLESGITMKKDATNNMVYDNKIFKTQQQPEATESIPTTIPSSNGPSQQPSSSLSLLQHTHDKTSYSQITDSGSVQ